MRVLHLISSGGMYGAEAVILNLSQELNAGMRDASRVGVFAHSEGEAPALYEAALQLDVPSERIPCKGQMDFSVLRRIRAAVNRGGIDVLHAHGYKADIYAYLAFRGQPRPALVSTCHTWYDNDLAVRLYGILDRWVLRSFDQVVAVSPEVRDQLRGAGVQADKVHLIRNGIRLAPFAQAPEIRALRVGGGDRLRGGLVGRLSTEKGVDLFLRAVAQLVDRFPNVSFVVAGDGPDRAKLESLIHELGLDGRAELAGAQRDMPAFYASLDLLVSASRQEGLPMALLEGMASGLPLVATKAGAVPDLVVDGETGILVDIGSPEALAGAMARVLTDTQLRTAFGTAGRQRVLEQFSAQRMTADYLAVYADALAARTPLGAVAPDGGFSG